MRNFGAVPLTWLYRVKALTEVSSIALYANELASAVPPAPRPAKSPVLNDISRFGTPPSDFHFCAAEASASASTQQESPSHDSRALRVVDSTESLCNSTF